jgi:type I restriction enzyme S subunit
MSMPRYGEYKDSGVEWLGHVPAHWGVDRLKASIASARNGIWGEEPQGDENDIACVRVADFDRGRLQVKPHIPTMRSVTEKERAGRVLSRGNLLLEKSGGGELQPVGQVVLYQLEVPAVCSNFVARLALKQGMCAGYWNYVHSAAYSVGVNVGSINQTSGIQNLDQDRYFNERAPFPPEEEQTAIAAFLDRETAKIDALIAEQEKLIALLAEKRRATVSHAVTRGLNPNAPTKDSGVAWLGEVPAHWGVAPLKHLVSLPITDGPHETPAKQDDGIPFVSAEALSKGFVDFNKMWGYISREDHARYSKRYSPKRGDILIVKLGATAGTTAIVDTDDEFNIWVPLAAVRLKHGVEPRFVCHVLKSNNLKRAYELNWTFGTQQTLGLGTISSLQIPVPPIEEQQEIAAYFDAIFPLLDSLTEEAVKNTDILKERRCTLIAAAVTGQIDVRSVVTI